MALVSMKSDESGVESYTPNPYGQGMTLRLDEKQCEALGILKPLAAGTRITLSASAFVAEAKESAEEDGDGGGNDVCMTLQITDMEIAPQARSKSKLADSLYGSGD